MAKKITIRLDDDTIRQIDELSRKTQIPKVRLTKQAYDLLFAMYDELRESYADEALSMSFVEIIKKNKLNKKSVPK